MIADLKQIKAGDLNVSYFETGPTDGVPVILLHGFPYDIHSYLEVVPVLSNARCRVIVPYLRGYGKTSFLAKKTIRSGQQAALGYDLLNLMNSIKIDKAILAGYDWGGRAACVVAALYPERCLGLISCNGYNIQDIKNSSKPSNPNTEKKLWYQYFFHSERGRLCLINMRHEFIKYLWQTWSPSWNFNDEIYGLSKSSFDNSDFVDVVVHSYKHRFGIVAGDPKFDLIEKDLSKQPKISVPSITIDGETDGVSELSNISKIKQKFLAHVRHQVLAKTGHNVPQEDPKNFSKAVLELAFIN
ncbi:alpha/beta hydrolase [Alphaproteobacteria bacterium]|nr:alpha/beta hydrolase [Alphaproteobacteria bacterium]